MSGIDDISLTLGEILAVSKHQGESLDSIDKNLDMMRTNQIMMTRDLSDVNKRLDGHEEKIKTVAESFETLNGVVQTPKDRWKWLWTSLKGFCALFAALATFAIGIYKAFM